jgi:hypothetical protein
VLWALCRYVFEVAEMVKKKEIDVPLKRTILPDGTTKASEEGLRTYEVDVHTSNRKDAGTDGDVYITV